MRGRIPMNDGASIERVSPGVIRMLTAPDQSGNVSMFDFRSDGKILRKTTNGGTTVKDWATIAG